MITKRIIPCLDVRDGRVVKGVNFEGLCDVNSPVELAKFYSDNGADELVFYDITASSDGRKLFTDILVETAKKVFIPLTVGGGINTVADFDRVLKCGADKVSVNSGAIRNPDLISQAAKLYGDQCVVLSVDAKRVDGHYRVFAKGGREDTGLEALSWIKRCVDMGAGEVVVNSIDTDGVKGGFDLEMLDAVCQVVDVPVIASGGAGCAQDFTELFNKVPGVDAGLAASIFHFGEVKISDLKQELKNNNIKAVILSNSNKTEKVKMVADLIGIPYIKFATKPLKRGFKKAQQLLDIPNENIAVVGDQIFTDVIGANRSNMFSILVEPLAEKDLFLTKIKRLLRRSTSFFDNS